MERKIRKEEFDAVTKLWTSCCIPQRGIDHLKEEMTIITLIAISHDLCMTNIIETKAFRVLFKQTLTILKLEQSDLVQLLKYYLNAKAHFKVGYVAFPIVLNRLTPENVEGLDVFEMISWISKGSRVGAFIKSVQHQAVCAIWKIILNRHQFESVLSSVFRAEPEHVPSYDIWTRSLLSTVSKKDVKTISGLGEVLEHNYNDEIMGNNYYFTLSMILACLKECVKHGYQPVMNIKLVEGELESLNLEENGDPLDFNDDEDVDETAVNNLVNKYFEGEDQILTMAEIMKSLSTDSDQTKRAMPRKTIQYFYKQTEAQLSRTSESSGVSSFKKLIQLILGTHSKKIIDSFNVHLIRGAQKLSQEHYRDVCCYFFALLQARHSNCRPYAVSTVIIALCRFCYLKSTEVTEFFLNKAFDFNENENDNKSVKSFCDSVLSRVFETRLVHADYRQTLLSLFDREAYSFYRTSYVLSSALFPSIPKVVPFSYFYYCDQELLSRIILLLQSIVDSGQVKIQTLEMVQTVLTFVEPIYILQFEESIAIQYAKENIPILNSLLIRIYQKIPDFSFKNRLSIVIERMNA